MKSRTDFTDYKFRCSSLGKLMTGVKPNLTDKQSELLETLVSKQRGGNITDKQIITLGQLIEKRDQRPELSVTTKNYLEQLHKEEVFGRNYRISNKYTEKGILVEEVSFSLYTDVTDSLFIKNKDRKSNGFITGEPDNTQSKIRDIKSSYSLKTFPMYDDELTTNDYRWQGQGYCELFDIEEFEIVYCLVNAPFYLIDNEIKSLGYKYMIFDGSGNFDERFKDLVVETVKNHLFTLEDETEQSKGLKSYCNESSFIHLDWFEDFVDIPKEFRVKKFNFERDRLAMRQLEEQVIRCRTYMNNLSVKLGGYIQEADKELENA